jgi:hypothetical protein
LLLFSLEGEGKAWFIIIIIIIIIIIYGGSPVLIGLISRAGLEITRHEQPEILYVLYIPSVQQ